MNDKSLCGIVCTDVCKSFDGKAVLHGINAVFPYGKTSVINGASGCGKTTLLRIIAGLESPSSGSIEGTSGMKISFLFQEDRLLPWLTAEKNVLAVINDRSSHALAARLLTELGLGNDLNKYPAQLSGGMKRRVAIARALAHDGKILLLDEALRGLDSANIENTVSVIKKYSTGKTLISVSHTLSALEAGADFILNL